MIKQLRFAAWCVVAVLMLSACSESPNVCGDWQRAVSDDAALSDGDEFLKLNADSTFVIDSRMTLRQTSEKMQSRLSYNVSISGRWDRNDNSLVLMPDTSSYTLQADTTSFAVGFADKLSNDSLASVKANLLNDLTDYLSDHYKDIYTNLSKNGLRLDNVVLYADTLLCTCQGSVIRWQKVNK